MVILGIDPGIAVTGYGVIDVSDEKASLIEFGAIRTNSEKNKEVRLAEIFRSLSEIIERLKPDEISIEQLFFNRNTKTALIVGESRGVALLVAGLKKIKIAEYTPIQVKECLTGYGRCKKNELREVVQMELNMEKPPKPIDASDALAIALTHSIMKNIDEDFER